MKTKVTLELLNAFLNDHWEDHGSVDRMFYDLISSKKEFTFSGRAYRAVITEKSSFNLQKNFDLYKSWSKTEAGLIGFVKNSYEDGLCLETDEVFIIEGEIHGIDISKIITYLKKEDKFEVTQNFNSENEIILTEPTSGSKLTTYSLQEFKSLF